MIGLIDWLIDWIVDGLGVFVSVCMCLNDSVKQRTEEKKNQQ